MGLCKNCIHKYSSFLLNYIQVLQKNPCISELPVIIHEVHGVRSTTHYTHLQTLWAAAVFSMSRSTWGLDKYLLLYSCELPGANLHSDKQALFVEGIMGNLVYHPSSFKQLILDGVMRSSQGA